MIGMARRALDEMSGLAGQAARLPGGLSLAGRPVFHAELGRAETRLRAARAAHREAVMATWAAARAGAVPPRLHTDLTVASVFAAETCADRPDPVQVRRRAAAALSQRMQRLLRDLLAARQHIGLRPRRPTSGPAANASPPARPSTPGPRAPHPRSSGGETVMCQGSAGPDPLCAGFAAGPGTSLAGTPAGPREYRRRVCVGDTCKRIQLSEA